MLLLHLTITILIIMVLVIRLKLNPAMSLILGAIYMGLTSGMGPVSTASTISSGFGGMMTAIGLSIGFGVMLGQLLAACGGIHSIAEAMLRVFGKEKSPYATGLTGYIASIPVFYDVVYVIIIPLAKGMVKATGLGLPLFVGALTLGAAATHSLVPPTPGPMAIAELLSIDMGAMIGFGLVLSIILFFISLIIYRKFFLDRGWFNYETDIDHESAAIEAIDEQAAATTALPGFAASLFPIALPIVLILMGTATKAITGEVPPLMAFFSDKVIALLLGAIAALILARRVLPREGVDKALTSAMGASGLVLLITGAGGSLAAVLSGSGIGGVIAGIVSQYSINIVLLTWLTAVIIRLAQGSGTVAMMTAAGLMAPVIIGMDVSPVWIGFAAATGGLFCGHVNDSGFWITTKLANLTTTGGLKTYTTVTGIFALLGLVLCLIGSAIF